MISLQDLYAASPAFIQTMMLNAYAAKIHLQRFGKQFEDALSQFISHERYSPEDIKEYQDAGVRSIIRHAYDTVPYYRRIMDERRLSPLDIGGVDDLEKLPLLTREQVRNNISELISRDYAKSNLVKGHTSGTTGSPLEFYWDKHACLINNVVDWRQKVTAGLALGDPHAVLLGRAIVPPRHASAPFWRMNYLHNQLWMSSFHMSPQNLPHYVEKLRKFKPAAIEGYPSTVSILASFLAARGESISLRAVFTSSETLLDTQREIIERVFGCKVFDFYGMAERVVFSTECEMHRGPHVNLDFGITEIVDDDGIRAATGTPGWVVGTSIHNRGMPFIRYRTSDVSQISTETCSCGRVFPLMSGITTKAEDLVVTRSGVVISPSVLTHPFKPLHGIEISQIVQEDMDLLTVKLVVTPAFDRDQERQLISGLQERLGSDMSIKIIYVDDIQRTSSGKFRWVVSKVPVKF